MHLAGSAVAHSLFISTQHVTNVHIAFLEARRYICGVDHTKSVDTNCYIHGTSYFFHL